jgi:hypothetical protein
MPHLSHFWRAVMIGALALGIVLNPLWASGTGGYLNLSTAWAGDAKKDSKGDKKKDSNKSKDTGDAATSSDPTDANLTGADEGLIDRDGPSDQGDSDSATIIIAYKKAALAAAQADAAVAGAKARLLSAHSRMAAINQAVHDARTRLDAARKANDQYAIVSAQATYDAVLIGRQAASDDVTTAEEQLSAAERKARNVHKLLDRTTDAASNKDITDRLADSIDAILGIDDSL